ncbi:Glycosyl transferases involved in cell wall biogenesis [Streptococcus infantarius subsp. infantarius]|nr:Glycosyl transferases involved in cell wall biogenesis [Streptococcus infantarius subsp. infantarius]
MSEANTPTVSVICTVYNKEKWLNKAIESFLSQKNVDLEIILIDDASTDNSKLIIQEFAQQYPETIIAIYNDKNLGITKTWGKACLAASGEYIARCDGDDYWVDDSKLEKQLNFLKNHPESDWCGTDVDFVDEDGVIIETNVFTRKIIAISDTYEKMMATRGFTAPSTWLVKRDLMLLVNSMLNDDINTADDTFNLQLDLFNHTQFVFLPEATVAYRVNQGSDSRPKSKEALDKRFDKLLETQLAYLDRYPNANYKEILRILLERHNEFEKELSQHDYFHSRVSSQKVTIYYATPEEGFSQEKALEFQLQYKDNVFFSVPEEATSLRIDLSELPSFYKRVALVNNESNTEILPSYTNGDIIGNYVMFKDNDPQLVYDISILRSKSFTLDYEMFNINDINQDDYIAKILSRDLLHLDSRVKELESCRIKYKQVDDERQYYKQELERMVVAYNSVTHSRRWTIPTAIMNFFRRKK